MDARYGIAELQNQAIRELCRILSVKPSLLDRDDIYAIITHTPKDSYHALAQLAIVVLVAQLEMEGATQTIGQYEDFSKEFDGFMVNMYEALRLYSNFPVPKKDKALKAKLFLQQDCIADQLKVEEAEPPQWVKDLCSSKPVVRPFAPGEIIEIE